jgi:hypothetical protein
MLLERSRFGRVGARAKFNSVLESIEFGGKSID